MKAACRFCHEIMEFEDPKPVVQREPCRCGLTADVRGLRITVIGIVCALIVLAGGCWLNLHYTTEQVKALPESYKAVPLNAKEKAAERLYDGAYEVVPKEKAKDK